MRTRRLAIKRETLTALSTDDLANVAGAAAHTIPDPQCVTDLLPPVIIEIDRTRVLPCNTSPCTS